MPLCGHRLYKGKVLSGAMQKGGPTGPPNLLRNRNGVRLVFVKRRCSPVPKPELGGEFAWFLPLGKIAARIYGRKERTYAKEKQSGTQTDFGEAE